MALLGGNTRSSGRRRPGACVCRSRAQPSCQQQPARRDALDSAWAARGPRVTVRFWLITEGARAGLGRAISTRGVASTLRRAYFGVVLRPHTHLVSTAVYLIVSNEVLMNFMITSSTSLAQNRNYKVTDTVQLLPTPSLTLHGMCHFSSSIAGLKKDTSRAVGCEFWKRNGNDYNNVGVFLLTRQVSLYQEGCLFWKNSRRGTLSMLAARGNHRHHPHQEAAQHSANCFELLRHNKADSLAVLGLEYKMILTHIRTPTQISHPTTASATL
ncbi:hypothetical protein Pelo_15348 [Pelomyxa schiedti]|nr:hypothetical protein Pelo_15348 [Pelomyxa schiedti]